MNPSKKSELSRLLSIAEVAEICLVSPKTIWRWIKAGDLRAIRLGAQWRIAPDDLKSFLQARRT